MALQVLEMIYASIKLRSIALNRNCSFDMSKKCNSVLWYITNNKKQKTFFLFSAVAICHTVQIARKSKGSSGPASSKGSKAPSSKASSGYDSSKVSLISNGLKSANGHSGSNGLHGVNGNYEVNGNNGTNGTSGSNGIVVPAGIGECIYSYF